MKPGPYKKHRLWTEDLTVVMQLGLTMAGCVAFCFWLGWEIDRFLNIKGIFAAIFALLGIVGGGVVCYRQINEFLARSEPEQNNESQDEGNPEP